MKLLNANSKNMLQITKYEAQMLIEMIYFSRAFNKEYNIGKIIEGTNKIQQGAEEIKNMVDERETQAGGFLLAGLIEPVNTLVESAQKSLETKLKFKSPITFIAEARLSILKNNNCSGIEEIYKNFKEEYQNCHLSTENREEYQKEMWKQASEGIDKALTYNFATKENKEIVDAYFLKTEFNVEV